MPRRALTTVAVASVLVLAGCGGAGPADGTTTEPPTPTPSATPPAGSPDYNVTVFDSGWTGHPILEGGLVYPDDFDANTSYYATLLTDASDTERFNRSQLPDGAEQFVNQTNFETVSLVVVQSYPKSSVPDYRVESVTRDGGRLDIRINDSSEIGTDDITLETVLIRVQHDGTPPNEVRIETQAGVTFDTDDGIVIVNPSGQSAVRSNVTLPLRSDNESLNVADARNLTIENTGSETAGYNATVVATLPPACRDADPPCGMPDQPVVVFQETGKLQPGESATFEDLIARHGEYQLVVEADLPDGQNDRQTVREVFEWRVTETYHSAFVTLSDDGVEITQGVE